MTFQFTRNGVTYFVHTEVGGDQTARVFCENKEPTPAKPKPTEHEQGVGA